MKVSKLTFRAHAIRRMFERRVSTDDVREVLEHGEKIEEYPEDWPYPSFLVLGWVGPRPLHVVAAENITDAEMFVISVYEPDPDQWQPGFKIRKEAS